MNSIDIQSLLTKYVQNSLINQDHYHQYQDYQQQDDGLLTHENYPKDTHTRVIFHKNKPVTNHHETKTIQIQIPDHAYSAVQVQTPEMQYAYTSPGVDSSQDYYYDQGDNSQGYYYPTAPDSGYQQSGPDPGYEQVDYTQQTQRVEYTPPVQSDSNEGHYNYHSQQKRSKKNRLSRIQLDQIRDIIKLDPIRA